MLDFLCKKKSQRQKFRDYYWELKNQIVIYIKSKKNQPNIFPSVFGFFLVMSIFQDMEDS